MQQEANKRQYCDIEVDNRMDNREVYEKKIYDDVFPAQLFVEQRNQEGLYFWPHWQEETEILYVTFAIPQDSFNALRYTLDTTALTDGAHTISSASASATAFSKSALSV